MQKTNESRDPYFDNLKFILIVLMVIGHFAFENRTNLLMNGLCNAIYSFHMPLFIFISGYFSKSIASQRVSDVKSLLIPYLVFEFFHYIFTKTTGLGRGHIQFTYPTYQNWYLLSLFTWRLIIPYFKQINSKIAFTIVVFTAICAGYVQNFNEFLSLYRSIYLFPFFVIGFYFNDVQGLLDKFKRLKSLFKALFICVFALIVIFSWQYESIGQLLSYAFIPNFGYSEQNMDAILRTFSLFFSSVMGFLFLFMIPRKQTVYTQFGKNTMTVYLTHIFFIWGIIYFIGTPSVLTNIFGIFFSIILAFTLSTPFAEKIFRPLIQTIDLIKKTKK